VEYVDLHQGWFETTLKGDMDLPTRSTRTVSNLWRRTEVTITVGTDGMLSTHITPIKFTPLPGYASGQLGHETAATKTEALHEKVVNSNCGNTADWSCSTCRGSALAD
jgi:hypothetical protein